MINPVDEAPTPPEEHECCGNGCAFCVWDLYYEELRSWQERQQDKPAPPSTD